MKDNKKIDGIEKELVEQYRRSHKSLPETGEGWRENVVSVIAGFELSTGRAGFNLEALQPSLLLRFSSVAALASILMVLLYFVFGSQFNPDRSVELLLDPVRSLGLEWMKGV